jgi:PTS system mannose-specific IID component
MKNSSFYLVHLRSFFVQALWNFERLQNVGFAYGILPFLRKLYPDPVKRREVLLRHLSFFNTHPYMINIVFGMVASLEEDMVAGKPVIPEQIDVLKNNMAGPLAAIGDTFFWGTWRPFTILVSVSLVLFFIRANNFLGTWMAPLGFLFIYNLLHIPFRYWSLKASYQLRTKIVEIIAELEFQYAIDILKYVGLLVLVVVLVFYFWNFSSTLYDTIVYLGVFLLAVVLGFVRVSPVFILYGVIVISIGIKLLRGF